MKKVGILIIGDEILLGRVTDTNSGAIARQIDKLGWRVVRILTVGDNPDSINAGVNELLDISDIIFTTGGLGPTKDDITKRVFHSLFGGEMKRNKKVTENIRQIFAGRNLKLNQLTLDQAVVPSSAEIVQNLFGTAPIMIFTSGEKTLVSMPGVPYELEGSLPEVVRILAEKYEGDNLIRHSTRIVAGISESALSLALDDFEAAIPANYKLAYLPDSPIIKLRLDCYGNDSRFDQIDRSLGDTLLNIDNLTIYSTGDKTLARIVLDNLAIKGMTLSTAESCTGGNIARLITAEAGASTVFNGSVVSYSNAAKTNILGVDSELIKRFGAVSKQVVLQMAQGACERFGTTCAIATSGIAGPDGGTPEKPVGTVWIAVKSPGGVTAECFHFKGDRGAIIKRASATALIRLLDIIS